MNMIYRADGPAWTVWKPSRKLIAQHLTDAWIAMWHAREKLREGNRHESLIWKKAARLQLELAKMERTGRGGVYGIHCGN